MSGNMMNLAKIPSGAHPVLMIASEVGGSVLDRVLQAWTVSRQCQVEIKRLHLEELQIREQAKLAHKNIQTDYRSKLQQLKSQKRTFELQLKQVEKEFSNRHLERMEVLRLAGNAQQAGQMELAAECMHTLIALGNQQVQILALIEPPKRAENKMLEV